VKLSLGFHICIILRHILNTILHVVLFENDLLNKLLLILTTYLVFDINNKMSMNYL